MPFNQQDQHNLLVGGITFISSRDSFIAEISSTVCTLAHLNTCGCHWYASCIGKSGRGE